MGMYRCRVCRQYWRRPEYRRVALGSVCSSHCFDALRFHPSISAGNSRADDDVPVATRAAVHERDRHRCRYCGTPDGLHLHHIAYRSEGVDHSEHNLILLCHAHHQLVHSNKRYWQPRLRAYIWELYVNNRRIRLVGPNIVAL